jgi:periplasmic copper chaperone A
MRQMIWPVVFACALVAARAADAHVTANPDEGVAGRYAQTSFRVSHGCSGTPTIAVRVKIPESVIQVRPQVKPGWDVEIKKRTLPQPIDVGHGVRIVETVDEVVWRGGPLPDAYYDEFGLVMKLPDVAGQTLWFPVVQECQKGVHRWIEIPAAGQKWDDLREPAPYMNLRAP